MLYVIKPTVAVIFIMIAGSRFWQTTKIIRALSEANYNKLLRQRDQPGPSYIAMSTSAAKPLTVPSDSDSDSEELRPLVRKRKRPLAAYDSSTESHLSLAPTKVRCSTSPHFTYSYIENIVRDKIYTR